MFILHSKLPSADVDGLGSGEPAAQRSQLLSGSLVERPRAPRLHVWSVWSSAETTEMCWFKNGQHEISTLFGNSPFNCRHVESLGLAGESNPSEGRPGFSPNPGPVARKKNAERLGFAPALQRRGFPFPIKCCCNFTFNWEDQHRY